MRIRDRAPSLVTTSPDRPVEAYSAERRNRFGPRRPNRAASLCELPPMTSAAATVVPFPARRERTTRVPRDLAHLSDEALVALTARGDETALAELYDRYGRIAYGLALRVVREAGLAEDAVQEAFLAVWRSAVRFVPERAKASTWILTLVHRRAVDVVRREERRQTEPLDETAAEAGDAVEDVAWLRLERERVQDALRRLPDTQREALELAYYGGFTQAQLAARLGQPLGTIKSRMFAGLTRLRELLEEPTAEEPWSRTPFTR